MLYLRIRVLPLNFRPNQFRKCLALTRKHQMRQFCKISVPGVWSPGKYYMFLESFEKHLLKILMCSRTFCLSWKIYCSWTIFGSPGKFIYFIWLKPPWKMYFRNLLKIKVTPGKKTTTYFSKIAHRLLLIIYWIIPLAYALPQVTETGNRASLKHRTFKIPTYIKFTIINLRLMPPPSLQII